jgi:hypothetical protein
MFKEESKKGTQRTVTQSWRSISDEFLGLRIFKEEKRVNLFRMPSSLRTISSPFRSSRKRYERRQISSTILELSCTETPKNALCGINSSLTVAKDKEKQNLTIAAFGSHYAVRRRRSYHQYQ